MMSGLHVSDIGLSQIGLSGSEVNRLIVLGGSSHLRQSHLRCLHHSHDSPGFHLHQFLHRESLSGDFASWRRFKRDQS